MAVFKDLKNILGEDNKIEELVYHNPDSGIIISNPLLYKDFDVKVIHENNDTAPGIHRETRIQEKIIPKDTYNNLLDIPKINGVELKGDLTGEDLKLNTEVINWLKQLPGYDPSKKQYLINLGGVLQWYSTPYVDEGGVLNV